MQTSVLEYLEDTAERMPEKIAFFDIYKSITYKELKRQSLCLAADLQEQVKKRNQPVLVYLEKEVSSIVAFMGILYSGNFYTPTDVRFPEKKLHSVISALNPAAVITDRKHVEKLKAGLGNFNPLIIFIDGIEFKKTNIDSKCLIKKILDVDPVYVFFTSGTTGIPKGVVINNHNIIDYIDWAADAFSINENTVIGNQSPFYFDISTQDIFATLKTGAAMGIIPSAYFAFPIKAIEFIKSRHINFLYWVPSAFVNVANLSLLDDIELDEVTSMMFGGEVMPVKQLNYWKNHLPNLKMTANVYGPTEATVNCTCFILNRDFSADEQLPLGSPCGNTGIFLIDKYGKMIQENEYGKKGEICVYGSSLSPGYWNDEEKSREKFVDNPYALAYHQKMYKTGDLAYYSENGEIIFSGRIDYQIKHSGYRIELGEIESAALVHENVKAAAVVYDFENKKIVLFYKGNVENNELEHFLHKVVPKYMVPAVFIRLNSLPLNDNGKIDRVKLKEVYLEQSRR